MGFFLPLPTPEASPLDDDEKASSEEPERAPSEDADASAAARPSAWIRVRECPNAPNRLPSTFFFSSEASSSAASLEPPPRSHGAMLLIGVVWVGGAFAAADSRRARAASATRRAAASNPGGGVVFFSLAPSGETLLSPHPPRFGAETRRSGFVGSNDGPEIVSRSSSSSSDTVSPRAARRARSASLRARASRDSCRRTYVRRGVIGGNRGSDGSCASEASRTYASATRARLGGGTGSTYVKRNSRSRAARARRTASSSDVAISASMRLRASEGSSDSFSGSSSSLSSFASSVTTGVSSSFSFIVSPLFSSRRFFFFFSEYSAAYARSTRDCSSTTKLNARDVDVRLRFRCRVSSTSSREGPSFEGFAKASEASSPRRSVFSPLKSR